MKRQSLPDDGLPCPQVGPWALQNYRILGCHNDL